MRNTYWLIALGFVASCFTGCACYVVDPGNRGVKVTLGEVSPGLLPEGFGTKAPIITGVEEVSVRQQTRSAKAACFSSDLQQVGMDLKVLFRIPEAAVIRIFRDYAGDPFDTLVAPRVQEALKEVTAGLTAEQIAKTREDVKHRALEFARKKVGDLVVLEDLVIENIDLSNELEHAIEAKMVQEQEAAKSKFVQQKAEVEARTAVIRAEGEANAIRIRGKALRESPDVVAMQIAEKWNGVAPLVLGSGANTLLPLAETKK